MRELHSALVVQTAFLGDVVLTLPMIQVLKQQFPSVNIDVVVTPQSAPLLANHPAVRDVIVYDKRKSESGVSGFFKKSSELRRRKYDVAIVPHRSVRSAALVYLANIPVRIGFSNSAGKFLFNKIVRYEISLHEVKRNIQLLQALDIEQNSTEYPALYPSEKDKRTVDEIISQKGLNSNSIVVGIAPGTVWNTKRWLKERYIELVQKLAQQKYVIMLIGGSEDASLCEEIERAAGSANVFSTAGKLTLLQSSDVIRRCSLLVSNDSAPMHLAVAMRTPVVAIYGATIPGFGFAPYGKQDVVVETKGLSCRPCSIHGGEQCPIKTFDCMVNISADTVFKKVEEVLRNNVSSR